MTEKKQYSIHCAATIHHLPKLQLVSHKWQIAH